MLEVRNVSAGYSKLNVLYDISLTVDSDEVVCVIGSNAAGKSTLLKTIVGLLRPREGIISFNGINVYSVPVHKITEIGIGYVPEGARVFPRMTVMENLLMGSITGKAKRMRKQSLQIVYELFPVLKERANQMAGTLSGGERQMLNVARALMCCPKLLLLDEPSMGLAPFLVTELYNKIAEIHKSGVAILLAEQDAARGLKLADRGYVIENGRILMEGDSKRLLSDQRIVQAYLGI